MLRALRQDEELRRARAARQSWALHMKATGSPCARSSTEPPTLGAGGFGRMLDTVNQIRARLSIGEHIVVHCRGGLGRAGTVAACILVSDGMEATAAIKLVRTSRPGDIETRGQEAFVRGFAGWLDREGLRSL